MPSTNILSLEKPDSGRGMKLMCQFPKFSAAAADSQTKISALKIIATCDIET
jgi:hypothetical protein